jgi:hypothetical protein
MILAICVSHTNGYETERQQQCLYLGEHCPSVEWNRTALHMNHSAAQDTKGCMVQYRTGHSYFKKCFHLPRGIQLVVTVLSHHCNSRMASGEVNVESCASSEIQPNQAALLLDTMPT